MSPDLKEVYRKHGIPEEEILRLENEEDEREIRRLQQIQTSKENVTDAIKTIFNELNRMGREEEIEQFIFDSIIYQHRTLQQNWWRAMYGVMKKVAKHESFDERNANSVIFCKTATESYGGNFPFI